MAKVAKNASAPPKKQSGRKSVRQAEVLEALELLKSGKGEPQTDEKGREFLVVELDAERVGDVGKARAALYNLRWQFNPKNEATGAPEQFERLFQTAGHGGLKIYDDGKKVYLAATKSYAHSVKAPVKEAKKTSAKAKSPAKGTATRRKPPVRKKPAAAA